MGASRGRALPDPLISNPQTSNVNTNVPFVVPPAPQQRNVDPNAMSLARFIGNIDFGGLAARQNAQMTAKQKLAEEQDRLKGQSQAAMFVAQGGKDMQKAIDAGVILPNQSFAFKTGFAIALSQAAIADLREAASKRFIENPDAGNFKDDQQFLAPYFARLNGLPVEAVAKYFVDPMNDLSKDYTTKLEKYRSDKDTTTLVSSVARSVNSGLANGDAVPGVINNSLNLLSVSHMNNPEAIKQVFSGIEAGLTQYVTDPITGRADLKMLGDKMREIAATKLDGKYGKDSTVATQFGAEFMNLRRSVYSNAYQMNQAIDLEKKLADEDAANSFYSDYMKTAPTNSAGQKEALPASQWIALAEKHKVPYETAQKLHNMIAEGSGNVSQDTAIVQDVKMKVRQDIGVNPSADKLDEYAQKIIREVDAGRMTTQQGNTALDVINGMRKGGGRGSFNKSDLQAVTSLYKSSMGDEFDVIMQGRIQNAARPGGGGIAIPISKLSDYQGRVRQASEEVMLYYMTGGSGKEALGAAASQLGDNPNAIKDALREQWSNLPKATRDQLKSDIQTIILNKKLTPSQWSDEILKLKKRPLNKVSSNIDRLMADPELVASLLPLDYVATSRQLLMYLKGVDNGQQSA